MFGLFFAFTYESRQASFSATMEAAAQPNPQEGMAARIAAALVRSPELTAFVARERADLPGLLAALSSSPPGESTFDVFQRITQRQAGQAPPTLLSESADEIPLPSNGFVGVRIPPDVAAFFHHLETQLVSAPEQSVSPSQILLSLLEFNSEIREVFEAHGFRVPAMREFLRDNADAV